SGRLLRRWYDPEIRLRRLPALWITLLCFLVGHRAGDDHILARLPVHWSCYLMFGGQLQGIDHSQHFIEIATSCHWVNEDQLNLFVWPDHVNVAHGRVIRRRSLLRVALNIGGEHSVQL